MARARKKGTRVVKPKIYIYCEGEKTEPDYIRAYINFKYPNSARLRDAERPVILKNTNKNTPKQLIDIALSFKKGLDFEKDQVWVVYDRESPQKYSDSLHKEAYSLALSNGIKVAISNVCFEYWLLLHLSNTAPAMSNCDTLINSNAFKKAFSDVGVKKYDKKGSISIQVSELLMKNEFLDSARNNAERNNKAAIKASDASPSEPYKIQPYTNMHNLLDAIDKIASE